MTIRGSLNDTIKTLISRVVLVILVVFVFLRDWRASLVPSVAVPVSIIGSFAAMYVLGFSLDNLSLMALTISTGFVVDDAIVVLENVTRHLEEGRSRVEAALLGAQEVSFTVVSISLSLVAVFLPLLLIGGIPGRLFKEFTITLSIAVLISMVVSLTTTPMMCALILPKQAKAHGRLYNWTDPCLTECRGFTAVPSTSRCAIPGLLWPRLLATVWLNVSLFREARYNLFPVQDTGLMIGSIQGDQSISFQAMKQKLAQLQEIVQDDPAVATVVGVTGGRRQFRFRLYLAETLRAAQDHRRRSRQPLAQATGAGGRRAAVSRRRLGPARRRPAEQRDLSIYDALRRDRRTL